MHRLKKTIVRLALWAVVIVSGYYGLIELQEGEVLRKQYLNEMHDSPCEFRLDATVESHIQVPSHHSFDGLHGCVLCRGDREPVLGLSLKRPENPPFLIQ